MARRGGDARRDRRQEARRDRRQEARRDRRQEAREDREGKRPKPVTQKLKEKSTQTGEEAMNATPSSYPAEPANAEAVYTTGPGQAVEYNYTRQGTYADQYAEEQQQVMVQGGPVMSGAANNPT